MKFDKEHYKRLSNCRIVGYIDSHDKCHSKLICFDDDIPANHSEHFSNPFVLRKWSWSVGQLTIMNSICNKERLSSDDVDLIRTHLENEYDLRFFDNGCYDWEYLAKMSK